MAAILVSLLLAEAVAAPETTELPAQLGELHTLLSAYPLLAPLLFILAYALAVTLFLPGQLLCLLGGMLFGPWLGALLNVLGATLGAVTTFLLTRHLATSLVERHLGRLAQRLKAGVEQQGWRFVAIVRLIPAMPYNLSCYAFGLCRIPLGQYAATTALCLLPRLTAYAYIGYSGMNLLSGEGNQLLHLVTIAGLVVALVLLPLLYIRRRPALKP